MKVPGKDDRLWTKKQVSAYFNVSTSTVDRIVARRQLPFIVVGGRRRFDPADLAAFLESRKFGGRE
jgi:excisionase family DNA binding protein